ncbi:hypothetical protein Gotur_029525, partial [Gossypium turneri]
RLAGYKTRNNPCLVAVLNAHPPQDTLSVDGACTSVARCLMLKIRTEERHQVLVDGNLHPIGDVMKYPEEGMTSYAADDCGLEDDSDVDSPREPGPDGAEVGLFSEPEPIPTEPEDAERSSDEEENPRFRAYSPPAHMHNVDLFADDTLEFLDLPHRLHDPLTTTSLNPNLISLRRSVRCRTTHVHGKSTPR